MILRALLAASPRLPRRPAFIACCGKPNLDQQRPLSTISGFERLFGSRTARAAFIPRQQRFQRHSVRAMTTSGARLELEVVDIDNPKQLNFILGHSHFLKTVEDMYETMIQSGAALKFGIAFCEASGDPNNPNMAGRKVRYDGNDEELIGLAKQNALKIGAGHTFIIFLDEGFPVNVLNAVKAVPEVCRIHCATANPTSVILAKLDEDRKGVLGVIDGFCSVDFENEQDKQKRHDFLRAIGYKR